MPIPSLLRRALVVLVVAGCAFAGETMLRRSAETSSTAPLHTPAAPLVDAYGIEMGAFETVDLTIARNQTFSDLLSGFNVPYEIINQVVSAARPVFDVRRLRAGKPFRIYHHADSLRTPRYLIYEQDPVRYILFDLEDPEGVRLHERPVFTVEREVEGVITSSLYNTLVDQGVDPALANELAEVYAWQIDFYGIQKGDRFKAIYEERQVEGEPVGLGRVLAARFEHAGRAYEAYHFAHDDTADYYDAEGGSLRKAFLMAPVKYSRISSRYSGRRFHPVQRRFKAHLGTDYAAPKGTPIRATGDGVVLDAQYKKYNGNYVKIRHNGTYTTGYLHMSKIAKGIRPGATVRQGDVIGYVGSTGLATGNHVCYRFWKNGQQVDHFKEDFPTSAPIAEAYLPGFFEVRDGYRARLNHHAGFVGPPIAVLTP